MPNFTTLLKMTWEKFLYENTKLLSREHEYCETLMRSPGNHNSEYVQTITDQVEPSNLKCRSRSSATKAFLQ